MLLTKSEVCRRLQCSPKTVEKDLDYVSYNGRVYLYEEEDVLELAVTRQEKKEERALVKAVRQANRERYINDPDYAEKMDARTETRRANKEARRAKVLSLEPEKLMRWARKGWLRTLFTRDEVEALGERGRL